MQMQLGEASKFFWGANAQFLSQNYIAAQFVYLLRAKHIGPFTCHIPETVQDRVFCSAPIVDFTVDAHYFQHQLFAPGFSQYVGQPILMAMGPTLEKARSLGESILITYDTNYKKPAITLENFTEKDVLFSKSSNSHGLEKVFSNDEYTIVDYQYDVPTRDNLSSCACGAYSFINNEGILNIYVTTDWPSVVRSHVARCLGIDEEKIAVYPLTQGHVTNNLFLEPVLWACYAAIATWKMNKPCKLSFALTESALSLAHGPKGVFNLSIAIDSLGNIRACHIDVLLAIGWHGYFVDEFIAQLYDGFACMYDFPNYGLSLRAINTNDPPCGPYVLTGRAMLQLALENGLNQLARMHNISPEDLRHRHIKLTTQGDGQMMEYLVSKAMERSDFLRKTLAYDMEAQKTLGNFLDEELMISLPLRGIGLASAAGTLGVITPAYQNYAISADWVSPKQLTLSIVSFPHNIRLMHKWKNQVAEHLGIDKEHIEIICHTSAPIAPYGLGTSVDKTNFLLPKLCGKLSKNLSQHGYPLHCSVHYEDYKAEHAKVNEQKRSLLSCIVEVSIDPVEFAVKITRLEFMLYCGRVCDERGLRSYFATVLIHMVHWLYHQDTGRQRIWRSDFAIWPGFELAIIRDDTGKEVDALSVEGLIESVLPAAYTTAVSQALNFPVTSFPVTPEMILKILQEKREEPV